MAKGRKYKKKKLKKLKEDEFKCPVICFSRSALPGFDSGSTSGLPLFLTQQFFLCNQKS